MTFSDGDKVVGHYGSIHTRHNGKWYSVSNPSEYTALSDETVEWLLNLRVKTAHVTPKSRKLSKSGPQPVEGFTYNWTLVPLDSAHNTD